VIGFLKPGAPAGTTNIDDLETDLTVLNNQNLKLNYQWTTAQDDVPVQPRRQDPRFARREPDDAAAGDDASERREPVLSGRAPVDG
jgi:hypothetical protein